jgi:hypothetical protein
MGRTLRFLGLALLAGAVWSSLAEAMGWITPALASEWGGLVLKSGLLCLAAGVLLRALSPVGRELRRGRCVRCGAPIERGQTYCIDHLVETVNEYRDRARARAQGRRADTKN